MHVFLDIEASGFDGYPIEIAWVSRDLAKGWSTLIQPTSKWVQSINWDKSAEAVHGLKWRRLMNHGLAVVQVAERLNADLAGAEVFSDNPSYDGKWLAQLFQAAGIEPAFVLSHAGMAIKAAERRASLALEGEDYVLLAGAMAGDAGIHRHSALDDAIYLGLGLAAISVLEAPLASREDLRADCVAQAAFLIQQEGREKTKSAARQTLADLQRMNRLFPDAQNSMSQSKIGWYGRRET